jgi:hypothetical protein
MGSEIICHLYLRGGNPKGFGTSDEDSDEEFTEEENENEIWEEEFEEEEENEPKYINQYNPDLNGEYELNVDKWTGWIRYDRKMMKDIINGTKMVKIG